MSLNPAGFLKKETGGLKEGEAADVAIVDLTETFTVDPETFLSKGKNTPFAGKRLQGVVRHTIVDGIIKYGGS